MVGVTYRRLSTGLSINLYVVGVMNGRAAWFSRMIYWQW